MILETITRGAEADVVVVREKATEEQRAIKLYRDSVSRVDNALLAALSEADWDHVVRTYARGHEGDEWWEELEYCQEGSLADLFARENTGAGLPRDRIREILDELIPAIAHLHTLSSGGKPLVHRDLKPANILVRSTDPHWTWWSPTSGWRACSMRRALAFALTHDRVRRARVELGRDLARARLVVAWDHGRRVRYGTSSVCRRLRKRNGAGGDRGSHPAPRSRNDGSVRPRAENARARSAREGFNTTLGSQRDCGMETRGDASDP